MRGYLDYPRFAGPPRMLVLKTDYFFDVGWARAAAALGWGHAEVRSAITGGLSREDVASLFTTIAEFKPDFILTSNYAGMDTQGIFARFFEDARIPYVSWFTDTPRMILFGREMHVSPYSVAATWERAYIPHFERLGFEHIHYMPLATDPGIFNAPPRATHDRNLAFVGTSMQEHAREAWEKHAHLPKLKKAVLKAFESGSVTRETFADGVEAILGGENLVGLDATERRNVELLLNYEATRRERAALARCLAPLGLEARGDEHWRGIAATVGGAVGYFQDLAPFYGSTAVNVNTTSLQMRWAVNQRVFDCPAAGGFLITDAQRDIDEHFEPNEVVTYASLEELREKTQFYLSHPGARQEITVRAQARILAHHTHAHRLSALAAFLRERFA